MAKAHEYVTEMRASADDVVATLERISRGLDLLDAEEDAEEQGPTAPDPGWRDPPREKPRR